MAETQATGATCFPCAIMGSIVFLALIGLAGWGLYTLLAG